MAAPNHKVDPIVKGYVKPELLTSADLIKGNQIILDVRTLKIPRLQGIFPVLVAFTGRIFKRMAV